MAPQGYADGLLKPANQVRAQKNLVKAVPGSNLPRQPAKVKRVKQSLEQQIEAHQPLAIVSSGMPRDRAPRFGQDAPHCTGGQQGSVELRLW